MKILGVVSYLDGGTVKVITTDEIYTIDSRIGTKTKYSIFLDYPKDDNSNIVLNQSDIKEKLRIAVEEYNELDSSWVVCTMVDFKPWLIEMLEFTFDCKVCGKPFGDKLSLYNHYDSSHNQGE
jgi:fructose 1,6-bisphosphatase